MLENITKERFYRRTTGDQIKCEICPRFCILSEGDIGLCGGRKFLNDELINTNYGKITSLYLDSIEKKPLYHFFPGSDILSVGTTGCNLTCKWCQNDHLIQNDNSAREISPESLVDIVDAIDGIGVAYTYAEPLIWFEYALDSGRLMHDRGLFNIFISNGFINPNPLKELLNIADAFNIDLKVEDDQCYATFCGGRLEDIHRTINMIYDAGKHLEITHLLVTGVSTDYSRLEKLVNWISAIDKRIPLHLVRYFPTKQFSEPPTDMEFMLNAKEIAKSKLDWVYLQNLWTEEMENSFCPCGAILVDRSQGVISTTGISNGNCKNCGNEVNYFLP
ncbi:AmmeMemoRadiSam system radical SAM enzyme [bacterium]|nr:AmmeMemoRadiSam system radical SAM enzyme [bacterium]